MLLVTQSWAQKKSPADIPNVGEVALGKLDESGIVYIGAEVVRRHPGRQGNAKGRNPADAGRESCCEQSSVRKHPT